MITALIVSFIVGPWIIRKLESLQARQVIRTDGPESHLKKQGTPTMGGVLILTAIVGGRGFGPLVFVYHQRDPPDAARVEL